MTLLLKSIFTLSNSDLYLSTTLSLEATSNPTLISNPSSIKELIFLYPDVVERSSLSKISDIAQRSSIEAFVFHRRIINYRIFFLTASILIIPTFFFGPINLASKIGT